jgi:hypothetical protein
VGHETDNWKTQKPWREARQSQRHGNGTNDFANEKVGNPAYPLDLFQRMITVSHRDDEDSEWIASVGD